MSSIQKMAIQGIRSFGPEDKDKQIITFFPILTLILGPNGTGKTTIIECLKYITTGDHPPGSKGGAFFHDPKIANEREVKGQVKLLFQDVSGKSCMVERSVLVTQKPKSLTVKTLDGVITRTNAEGKKVSATSRCVEMDREMVTSLGVSKAVLENVIFCHQEDSNWPLSEGKALKDKFDAIFASTRYVKALEAIRKVKMNQDSVLKEYRTEIKYLRQNKEKSQEIRSNLESVEESFDATKESKRNIEEKIKPIEEKLEKIFDSTRDINKLSSQKGKLLGEKDMLEKTIEEILGKLQNEFQGTTKELKKFLSEFQGKVQDTEATVNEFERKKSSLKRDLDKVNDERSKIDVEVGKMEQSAQDHLKNIKLRESNVKALAEEYSFEGFNVREITNEKYADFEKKVAVMMKELSDKHIETKEGFVKKEEDLQKKINGAREEATKVEHDIRIKKETSKKNTLEIRDLNRKLSEVDASAGRLDQIKEDLRRLEQDLDVTESSVNVDQLKAEINKLQQEKQTLDATLSALSSEMSRLHLESSHLTEMNMLKKDKTSKEEGIRKVKAKHEDTLKYLLGRMPQNVREDLDEFIVKQSEDVKQMESAVQKSQRELSTKEANRKMLKDQLKKKEEELKVFEEKISEVCEGENVEAALKTVQKKMGQAQDQRGSLLGAQHFFKKYVEDLQKNNPCCPLCHREFDEDQEVRELILELQQKLRMVPSKVDSAENELKHFQQKYDAMLQLRPVQENICSLEDTDLPELRNKLSKLGTEVETLRNDITEREEDLQSKQGDLSMAQNMTADVILMDRYLGELRELERKITVVSAKLTNTDSTRSMQQVHNEKEETQLQLETVNKRLDHKRDKVSSHSEQVQKLKSQVNEMKGEKLQIEQEVQQRCKLEERKTLIQTENDSLVLDLEEQEELLGPLKTKIRKLEEDKTQLSKEKDTKVDSIKRKGESIRNKMQEVHSINKQIKRYIEDQRDEALQRKKEIQSRNIREANDLTEELTEMNDNIDKLRREMASQKVKERELQDNLELRDKKEAFKRLEEGVEELKEKIGGLDPVGLDRERNKLEKQRAELSNEKIYIEARRNGYLEQIKLFKKDLSSDQYKDATEKCREKAIALRTTELANKDLEKYYMALDKAIMKYHNVKMAEINKIIRELWRNTYRGNDIETIEIRSDEEDSGAMKSRRVYNYRVVMVKGTTDLDMRGRCSAGQKVLASLIIRLALAETFCLNCGILALDEPTTNLDRENIESLAYALVEIIKGRSQQKNFQLIVITHDEDFVELLGRSDYVDDFYRIKKNSYGCSQITSDKVSELHSDR